jgi:hypothetical protein
MFLHKIFFLVEKVCIQLRKCYVLNFMVVEGRDGAGGLGRGVFVNG